MGKQQSQSSTTRKKEPHRAGVSEEAPKFQTVVAEMAWQVAIPFMGFTLGGNWLDGRYDTEPLFTIVGLFIGVASVSLVVRRLIQKFYPDTFKKEDS